MNQKTLKILGKVGRKWNNSGPKIWDIHNMLFYIRNAYCFKDRHL